MLASVNAAKMDITAILTPQMLRIGAWISWKIERRNLTDKKKKQREANYHNNLSIMQFFK